MSKKFYVMWANDEGHSPPTETTGSSARQVAEEFMRKWPDFDGQLHVFAEKPVWSSTGPSRANDRSIGVRVRDGVSRVFSKRR